MTISETLSKSVPEQYKLTTAPLRLYTSVMALTLAFTAGISTYMMMQCKVVREERISVVPAITMNNIFDAGGTDLCIEKVRAVPYTRSPLSFGPNHL